MLRNGFYCRSDILDKDGKVAGIVVVFRDVTQEREVDRMKTEFISIASHQLRTPLTAMRWYSELLLSETAGKITKEQKAFTENIHTANLRLIDLVNALLNITRIESGRIIIEPVPTKVPELIESVINDVKQRIESKKQKLELHISKDLPTISIDPKMIREVYLNFLTNANKYTPDGGTITIRVETTETDLISSVTDTGYGIPEKEQKRVFAKFYRGENILKVIGSEGSGLGLYFVKLIIEASGGKVWFESTEGKGSTFFFSLPLKGSKAKKGEVRLS